VVEGLVGGAKIDLSSRQSVPKGRISPARDVRHGLQRMFKNIDLEIHRSNKAGAGSAPIGSNPGVGTEALTPAPGIDVPTLVIQGSRDKKWRQAMTW